jgi:hypothetical protein
MLGSCWAGNSLIDFLSIGVVHQLIRVTDSRKLLGYPGLTWGFLEVFRNRKMASRWTKMAAR